MDIRQEYDKFVDDVLFKNTEATFYVSKLALSELRGLSSPFMERPDGTVLHRSGCEFVVTDDHSLNFTIKQ